MSSLKQKIKKAIRLPYWVLSSLITKNQFISGDRLTYRFMDDVFYKDREMFLNVLKEDQNTESSYWKNLSKFDYRKHFPDRYDRQKKMLFENFIPLFNEKPELIDVGSAEGEWTAMVAPYTKEINAYEYSPSMVEYAKNTYGDVSNITFEQGDAKKLNLKKKYDGAMFLGVTTCISSDEDVFSMIKNIYESLKWGGYLVTKDTINREGLSSIYMYNSKRKYDATYRSQDKYYKFFEDAGFRLKEEFLLGDGRNLPIFRYSRGAIWVKEMP